MSQQYGLRASNNLSEALNNNACLDNLGINRNDLPLLEGTSASGVTEADYQAIIGLSSSLNNQITSASSLSISGLTAMSTKASRLGDNFQGTVIADIVNNDRPFTDAGNNIYGPSSASFFSPASGISFASGAQYKLGTISPIVATISGVSYVGTKNEWSNQFVRYKQYLRVGQSPSWTVRYSPLYLAPPTTLSSNRVWLDSEYSAFETSSGLISQWKDVQGRASAVQLTTASQPAYATNVLNGKPAVVFDGSNDSLALGNLAGSFPLAATLVVVVTLGESISRGDAEYNLFGTLNNTSNRWNAGTGAGNLGLFTSTITTGFPSSMPTNGTYVFSIRTSQSLGIELRSNGIRQSFLSNQFTPIVTYDAGSDYRIGASGGASAGFFQGSMYALALFDTVLTDKELRGVEEYFAWRYNFVYDPDRIQGVELENGQPLETEGGASIDLG